MEFSMRKKPIAQNNNGIWKISSSQKFFPDTYDFNFITKVALEVMQEVIIQIRHQITNDPNRAFTPMTSGPKHKKLISVDHFAETLAANLLSKKLKRYAPKILGEESLNDASLDLSDEKSLCVLLDMLDGSDLAERGFSNWCSAMVFFLPSKKKILAAFIAMPDDDLIYFARHDVHGAFKCKMNEHDTIIPVIGPSSVITLADASLSFYGQKSSSFCSLYKESTLMNHLYELNRQSSNFRIYNFAGNPVMTKLVDNNNRRRIDVVIEVSGQLPHDAVPGLYIAKKAGAKCRDIQGEEVDLAKSLLRPADKSSSIKYILTSTDELLNQVVSLLN
jgi:fructose-1,6-bisphosphatase/inositol monophosphatase family enzyme